MTAEIISVGDELLNGMTINTNAAFIAESLVKLGFSVQCISVVGDHEEHIIEALERAGREADTAVITGGLGVTHDDITKKAAARFFNKELIFSQKVSDRIESFFKKRGRKVSDVNREQAMVLKDAGMINNSAGLAPGFIISKNRCTYYFLPGVPLEMKQMMEKSVVPELDKMGLSPPVPPRILKTTGISESALYSKLIDFQKLFPGIRLAYLPETPGVKLRLSTSDPQAENQNNAIDKAVEYIQKMAGKTIYGEGETEIEQVVASLLFKMKLTIAVAESCTGGLISHKLTQISGSSEYFNRGIVAYSNEAKIEILNVPRMTIEKYGAVSRETALAMAFGVRKISGTEIGLSVTGIAGPGGGTAEKPVGLVYIGYKDSERNMVEEHHFQRDRWWNKERTAVTALDLVRRVLLGVTSS
jgi:nicotinamide-nucleotide amidase